MPLQKQYIDIPLGAAGIDSGRESKIIESPKLIDMENCEINEFGALEMRTGYLAHGLTDLSSSTVVPIALASRFGRKVSIEEDRILEYDDSGADWAGYEKIPNGIDIETWMIFSHPRWSQRCIDLVQQGDYLFIGFVGYTDDTFDGVPYVLTYNLTNRTIVRLDRLVVGLASAPKLAVVGSTVMAFFRQDSSNNIDNYSFGGVDTGWSSLATYGNFDGAATFATLMSFDVCYDGNFAYVAGQSTTSNQVRVVRCGEDGVADYSVSMASGTTDYDVVSITKHPDDDVLLVVTADSTDVRLNNVDSTDGSQDVTGTISITDCVRAIGFPTSATHFGLVLERDISGSDVDDQAINIYTVPFATCSETLEDTFHHFGLATKTQDTYSDTIRFGVITSSQLSPVLQIAEYDSGDDVMLISGRVGINQAAPDYDDGSAYWTFQNDVCGVSNASASGDVYFAYPRMYKVVRDSGITYNYSGLAIAKYSEDKNKLYNFAECQNGLMLTGGRPMWWDGLYPVPLGFITPPSIISLTQDGSGGMTPSTTYSYIAIYEYIDRYGQIHRSAPSTASTITFDGDGQGCTIVVRTCADRWNFQLEEGNSGGVFGYVALYRTEGDGTVHYRTSQQYLDSLKIDCENVSISISDIEADSDITDNELLYTTGGVLENDPWPPCECAAVHKNRLWVVDVETGDICHSKEFIQGEGPAFSTEFRIPTGHQQNRPIWLVSMDENLVVFWEDKIGVVYGDGPNDLGQGGTFTLPRQVAQIGLDPDNRRAICKMPMGIMFMASDGIKLLDRSMQVVDVGRDVAGYYDTTWVGAHHMPKTTVVRFTGQESSSYARCLDYDYRLNQWYRHKIRITDSATPVDAIVWSDVHHILKSAGTDDRLLYQSATDYYDSVAIYDINQSFQTNWIKLNGLQGYSRIYKLWLLGEYVGAHHIYITIEYDYDDSGNVVSKDGVHITNTETAANSDVYQFKIGIPKQNCQAIRFTILTDSEGTANACAKFTGLSLVYGVKPGGHRYKNTHSTTWSPS